jgi:hypothetical protein
MNTNKVLALLAAASFAISAHAGIGLGSTLSECTNSWGQITKTYHEENGPDGDIGYVFVSQGYSIEADFFHGKVYKVHYTRLDGTPFTPDLIKAFIVRTVPDAGWTEIDTPFHVSNGDIYGDVTFLTDGSTTSFGNVDKSSSEAMQAALSWTIQAVRFDDEMNVLHILSRNGPPNN